MNGWQVAILVAAYAPMLLLWAPPSRSVSSTTGVGAQPDNTLGVTPDGAAPDVPHSEKETTSCGSRGRTR